MLTNTTPDFIDTGISYKSAEEIATTKINKLNQNYNVPSDRFIAFTWHISGAPGALMVKYLRRLAESLNDNNPKAANAEDEVDNYLLLSPQDTQDKYFKPVARFLVSVSRAVLQSSHNVIHYSLFNLNRPNNPR